jgi:hypothetical protein
MSSPAASNQAQAGSSTAPVLEFICLFTHDLKRKQKRWQDGRLKYHTFNKRIMVYDERGNFVGDSHWQEDYDFDDGEEVQLERGGVIVQASQCVGSRHQDLSELIDKRTQEKAQRQSAAVARRLQHSGAGTSPADISQAATLTSRVASTSVPHQRLHNLLGTPTGHHGRAKLPSESPFEQRHSMQSRECETPRPAKRRKRSISPPSKAGYAQSLFGATLTLSAQPIARGSQRPLSTARPWPHHAQDPVMLSSSHVSENASRGFEITQQASVPSPRCEPPATLVAKTTGARDIPLSTTHVRSAVAASARNELSGHTTKASRHPPHVLEGSSTRPNPCDTIPGPVLQEADKNVSKRPTSRLAPLRLLALRSSTQQSSARSATGESSPDGEAPRLVDELILDPLEESTKVLEHQPSIDGSDGRTLAFKTLKRTTPIQQSGHVTSTGEPRTELRTKSRRKRGLLMVSGVGSSGSGKNQVSRNREPHYDVSLPLSRPEDLWRLSDVASNPPTVADANVVLHMTNDIEPAQAEGLPDPQTTSMLGFTASGQREASTIIPSFAEHVSNEASTSDVGVEPLQPVSDEMATKSFTLDPQTELSSESFQVMPDRRARPGPTSSRHAERCNDVSAPKRRTTGNITAEDRSEDAENDGETLTSLSSLQRLMGKPTDYPVPPRLARLARKSVRSKELIGLFENANGVARLGMEQDPENVDHSTKLKRDVAPVFRHKQDVPVLQSEPVSRLDDIFAKCETDSVQVEGRTESASDLCRVSTVLRESMKETNVDIEMAQTDPDAEEDPVRIHSPSAVVSSTQDQARMRGLEDDAGLTHFSLPDDGNGERPTSEERKTFSLASAPSRGGQGCTPKNDRDAVVVPTPFPTGTAVRAQAIQSRAGRSTLNMAVASRATPTGDTLLEPSLAASNQETATSDIYISTPPVLERGRQAERPKLANPASRGRKAARPCDAAGKPPQSFLPSEQVALVVPSNRAGSKRTTKPAANSKEPAIMPGFLKASVADGPWSREAFDLLEFSRPT